MHRVSPLHTAFRSYFAGGSRSIVESADDSKLMQEMKGSGLRNQSHSGVEAPQNYGFTSVVMDGDKDDKGNVISGAETTFNYMGGSTSLPMAGNMDDRRHRLKELEKGDSAMFRTKDDRQQFHMSKEGTFMSVRDDRKHRIALVPKPQQQQQQGNQPSVTPHNGGGGGSGDSGSGQQQQQSNKPTGQKSALDDNKKSSVYFEQNGGETSIQHNGNYSSQRGSDSTTYTEDRTKSTQTTSEHVHIRFDGMRIFVDREGCWSTMPILQKKDAYCKE